MRARLHTHTQAASAEGEKSNYRKFISLVHGRLPIGNGASAESGEKSLLVAGGQTARIEIWTGDGQTDGQASCVCSSGSIQDSSCFADSHPR